MITDNKKTNIADFIEPAPLLNFTCPSCGDITQDDVMFLCNVCKQDELILKDGVYMCPSCLEPGENFECIKCGSKKVKLKK